MDPSSLITNGIRSLEGLAPAVGRLEDIAFEQRIAQRAADRGYFKPDEEDALRAWFARYLTARAGLLETIDELSPLIETRAVDDGARLRAFVIAYTAACLLVRGARTIVGGLATDKVVQRKLNEASVPHRIPRKQYTRLYRALTSPRNAWRLREAVVAADRGRSDIEALQSDPAMQPVLAVLGEAEASVRADLTDYVKARLRYRWHSWRRRRASAAQRGLFGIAEAFGRVIADIRAPGHRSRATSEVRAHVAALLRPGDVIVTRHENALSNLFLPGYWPHAALLVGPPSTRDSLRVAVREPQAERWVEPYRVLEARKDGVRLRALPDTLDVDAFTIVRPRLEAHLAAALARALEHEGKMYNFDFDFFTDDRLVCTEVVYRAYEGVGGIEFQLQSRAGRLTLSAEDLLDMAVDDRGFETVAVFGTPGIGNRLVTGAEAAIALRESTGGKIKRASPLGLARVHVRIAPAINPGMVPTLRAARECRRS